MLLAMFCFIVVIALLDLVVGAANKTVETMIYVEMSKNASGVKNGLGHEKRVRAEFLPEWLQDW